MVTRSAFLFTPSTWGSQSKPASTATPTSTMTALRKRIEPRFMGGTSRGWWTAHTLPPVFIVCQYLIIVRQWRPAPPFRGQNAPSPLPPSGTLWVVREEEGDAAGGRVWTKRPDHTESGRRDARYSRPSRTASS